MESHSSDKRIHFLKEDGTELFTEGDIVGATDMYITALQLEMDQSLQAVISRTCNTETCSENNNTTKDPFLDRDTKKTDGINRVIEAVLDDADEAIKVNPSLPKAYLSKATALILQDKWDEARDVYVKGIKTCDNCTELRQAYHKLKKTQSLLRSVPIVLEKTKSESTDMLSEPTTDEWSSPSPKSKRFRMQHRKKLSIKPKSNIVMSTNRKPLNGQNDTQEKAASNTSFTTVTTESTDSSSDSYI